jgi:hypothetical protein
MWVRAEGAGGTTRRGASDLADDELSPQAVIFPSEPCALLLELRQEVLCCALLQLLPLPRPLCALAIAKKTASQARDIIAGSNRVHDACYFIITRAILIFTDCNRPKII